MTRLIVAFRNFANAPETKADTACSMILNEKLIVVNLFKVCNFFYANGPFVSVNKAK
jgi:hypothetical protein